VGFSGLTKATMQIAALPATVLIPAAVWMRDRACLHKVIERIVPGFTVNLQINHPTWLILSFTTSAGHR